VNPGQLQGEHQALPVELLAHRHLPRGVVTLGDLEVVADRPVDADDLRNHRSELEAVLRDQLLHALEGLLRHRRLGAPPIRPGGEPALLAGNRVARREQLVEEPAEVPATGGHVGYEGREMMAAAGGGSRRRLERVGEGIVLRQR